MSAFEKAAKLYREYPILVIAIAIVLILPLVVFGMFTNVETGTKTICKYNHVIKDRSKTITVFRWNTGKYKVAIRRTVCTKHKDVEILKQKIKESRKRGDKEQANALNRLLESANAAVSSTQNKGISGGKDGKSPFYSGDLIVLFPSRIRGYKMVSETAGPITANRMYSPESGAHPEIQQLTIALNQLNTEEEAKKSIEQNIKPYYAADGKNTSVNNAEAYFGTDGQDYAVLAYQINGVVFNIEILSKNGSPKDLYDDIIEVGSGVP
ncbi:MAG TPA: hypothetical protein VGK02_03535 [Candidatus Aquicultor sp.]